MEPLYDFEVVANGVIAMSKTILCSAAHQEINLEIPINLFVTLGKVSRLY